MGLMGWSLHFLIVLARQLSSNSLRRSSERESSAASINSIQRTDRNGGGGIGKKI